MSEPVHILVVVAHPDDAELALGGAIAGWTAAGVRVTVACCSISETTPELAARRRVAAGQAANVLGHDLLWVPPGDLRQVEDIPEYQLVGALDSLVHDSQADLVVAHSVADPHGDHRRVAHAVIASARTWPDVALAHFAPNEYRAPSVEFRPTILIPVAATRDDKARALESYSYPGQGYRPLRIEEVAARDRALGTSCGVEAAEGLVLARVVAGTRGARALASALSSVSGTVVE